MPTRPSVLFVGSRYWCRHLVRLFDKYQFVDGYTWRGAGRWIMCRNKSVCLVGLGPPNTYKRRAYHFFAYVLDRARFIGKRVVYWIGSDVSLLRKRSGLLEGAVHIAGSSWLAEEVRDKGYACEERLFPVELPVQESLPFPGGRRLQVLCYVPDAHHELHGSAEIRWIVEEFVDADFKIIGGIGKWWPDRPDNVEFLGWTDSIVEFLAEAHVLLRRTSHDSLSAFVREGLVAGRPVIFTYDVPGGVHVDSGDKDALMRWMQELSDRVHEGRLRHIKLEPNFRRRLVDTRLQLQELAEVYD